MSSFDTKHPLRIREKLITQGPKNLSDPELLAAFISSGNAKKSCLQLAFDLLAQFGDLRAILHARPSHFQKITGMGLVRYVQLQAAREMCQRADFIDLQKEFQLHNFEQTYSYLKRQLRDQKNETFAALFLDNQHRILSYEVLFSGTIHWASVHPRPIVERIISLNAAAIILAHNHPSGCTEASAQDEALTERLRQAFELVDARLLDHVIIGDNRVYSIINKLSLSCH